MKYRNMLKKYGGQVATATGALLVPVGAALAQTSSYIDGSVSGGFTQAQSDFKTLIGYVWPLVMLVAFSFWAIKIFRKGAGKAS